MCTWLVTRQYAWIRHCRRLREVAQDGEIDQPIVVVQKAVLPVVSPLDYVERDVWIDEPRMPRHVASTGESAAALTDTRITYVVRNSFACCRVALTRLLAFLHGGRFGGSLTAIGDA